ncbi:MAG: hypothetical protein NZ899_15375, partial [Thermoguttaceae bacterium]|nr:hypothetical protein [Thermoguttaceae bacterium]
HREMDRVVALKILPPERMRSAQLVERFRREVRAAARLIHPNIVTAFDAGEAKGVLFFGDGVCRRSEFGDCGGGGGAVCAAGGGGFGLCA